MTCKNERQRPNSATDLKNCCRFRPASQKSILPNFLKIPDQRFYRRLDQRAPGSPKIVKKKHI